VCSKYNDPVFEFTSEQKAQRRVQTTDSGKDANHCDETVVVVYCGQESRGMLLRLRERVYEKYA
jgi:hypothetical protein